MKIFTAFIFLSFTSNALFLNKDVNDLPKVQEIISKSCSQCHHPKGPAPFSLTNPNDFKTRRDFIKTLIKNDYMPPWEPLDSDVSFKKKYALKKEDKKTLLEWLNNIENKNTIKNIVNNKKELPKEATPDFILKHENAWTIPSELKETGHSDWNFRTFIFPICSEHELKVRGIEYSSTAPKAITSGLFAVSPSERTTWLDSLDDEPGYDMRGDIGWVPSGSHGSFGIGAEKVFLPNGFHWEWPRQSWLALEVSYRPTGKTEALQQFIDVHLENDSDSRPLRTLMAMIRDIRVPANARRIYETTIKVPLDLDLVLMLPRTGPRCRSVKASLKNKINNEEITLLEIRDHNPHWRRPLLLDHSMRIPKGSEIHVEWLWDNTEDHPGNPELPPVDFRSARKTGASALLLQVAAVNKSEDQKLQWYSLEEMKQAKNTPSNFRTVE